MSHSNFQLQHWCFAQHMVDFEIQPPTCESHVANLPPCISKKTSFARYLVVIYYSLFIAHISTSIPDGPSLSYMMFFSSCNTLLHNAGSFILIHACFAMFFFTCHKHKKMVVSGHIVL